ncbi:MAG: cell division topological specificity factor MinE [Epsilonproteobacteria bacterium]|nr:cell division topological specificity factor MinE [Campylobacterota bacterium]
MFDLWRRKRSASVAKNRLSIAIMSDRGGDKYPFMDELKSEIVAVVKRYMGVRSVEVKKEVDGNIEAISIDVLLDIHRT